MRSAMTGSLSAPCAAAGLFCPNTTPLHPLSSENISHEHTLRTGLWGRATLHHPALPVQPNPTYLPTSCTHRNSAYLEVSEDVGDDGVLKDLLDLRVLHRVRHRILRAPNRARPSARLGLGGVGLKVSEARLPQQVHARCSAETATGLGCAGLGWSGVYGAEVACKCAASVCQRLVWRVRFYGSLWSALCGTETRYAVLRSRMVVWGCAVLRWRTGED